MRPVHRSFFFPVDPQEVAGGVFCCLSIRDWGRHVGKKAYRLLAAIYSDNSVIIGFR